MTKSTENVAQKAALTKEAALPPGTPIYVGRPREGKARVSAVCYDEAGVHQVAEVEAGDLAALRQANRITWVRVEGVHDLETIRAIDAAFGLHPLVTEDIVNTHQRPKLEDYDDYLFLVLRTVHMEEEGTALRTEQASLILGRGFVLSFLEGDEDPFGPVLERIIKGQGRIRRLGADYLAYTLMDAVVDHYFMVLEAMNDHLEITEEEILSDPGEEVLRLLHRLKREMLTFRRAVWPLREVTGALERGDSELIDQHTRLFLRDVYDPTVQVIDIAEVTRDTLSTLLETYLSSLSNSMNEVMKVLTIIATLFIPLTFLAGVYGMNFKYMPELEWTWSYPALLAVMAMVAGVMVLYFRRKKWL